MAEATRTAQVFKEMAAYGIEILGLSETRWRGMGSVTLGSGEKVVYVEGARSERLTQRRREEYKVKDKEVKQSAREDKRNWLEEKAAAAKKAAENGRSRELYNMIEAIAGERKRQEVGRGR